MSRISPWNPDNPWYVYPWWKRGKWFDFFLANTALIQQTIQEMKLQAVPAESLLGSYPGEELTAALKPRPFPGGIRIPHLHFKGDTYLMNEEQWKKFSSGVIRDFQAKLAKVNTVSFEHAMQISEALNSLP